MAQVRRLERWSARALLAGGAQASVALLGFGAGIIILRSLSPREYAYYTIANAALGLMTMLSDSGLSSGVMAQGGQVWRDRARLGTVLSTAMALRRRGGVVALLLGATLAAVLLRRQAAGTAQSIMIMMATLPLFAATLTGQLLELVPRLHQRLLPLQAIQVAAAAARLAVAALVVPRWPSAGAALLCASLPQCWLVWRLRRLADIDADWRTPPDAGVRATLLDQMRSTLPAALYNAFSGQLTVWLASFFGLSGSVAAVGALGRFSMVLSAIGGIFNVVMVPRFARLAAGDETTIRRRYWQLQGALAVMCLVPFAALALFPTQVLLLLGPHYAGLEHEAVLMAASSMVGTVTALAYTLGATRGVVAPPYLLLPYCLAGQVLLVLVMPLHTVAGIIWVALLSEASLWLLHTVYYLRRTR